LGKEKNEDEEDYEEEGGNKCVLTEAE